MSLVPFTRLQFEKHKNCINCKSLIKTRKYIFNDYACSIRCESELIDKNFKAHLEQMSKPKVYCKTCKQEVRE